MKCCFKWVLVLLLVSALDSRKAEAQYASVSFQVFYDELSPYGTWADFPQYGYCWIPDYGESFYPYATSGYWAFSDFGWTWVSFYPWGWAPFHYGRWLYDPFYGWIWVPGMEWAPAWVVWRYGGGYCGWAPMEPGVTVSMAFSSAYYTPHERWVFVEERHLGSRNMEKYYGPRSSNPSLVSRTTLVTTTDADRSRNTVFPSGPRKEDIEKATGGTIKSVTIKEADKAGQKISNGELRIYKPPVKDVNERNEKPVPPKVTELKNVKTKKEPEISQPKKAPSEKKEVTPRIVPPQKKEEQPRSVPPASQPRQEPPKKIVPSEQQHPPRQTFPPPQLKPRKERKGADAGDNSSGTHT